MSPEAERRELVRVGAGMLFPVVDELLRSGKLVKITVTGNSMYPMIRSLKDTVVLESSSFGEMKRPDIVLIRRASGHYVLHRVYKKRKDRFLILGDRQDTVEVMDPSKDSVIARAIAIQRGDRFIPCNSGRWLLFARIWLLLTPVRTRLISLTGRLLPKARRLFRFGKAPKKN